MKKNRGPALEPPPLEKPMKTILKIVELDFIPKLLYENLILF